MNKKQQNMDKESQSCSHASYVPLVPPIKNNISLIHRLTDLLHGNITFIPSSNMALGHNKLQHASKLPGPPPANS